MKLFIFLVLFLQTCSEDDSVRTYSISKQGNPQKVINEKKIDSSVPFYWDAPETWSEGKKSSMRLASYSVPFSDGIADLSITNFSGDGGGVLANINRWRGQLDLPPQSIDEANQSALIAQSKIGEFKMYKIINNSNEDSAFLCSILQIKNSTIFVKLISTANGVKELESEFITFCSSFNYSNIE